ncbi:hypothetical protein ACUSIJ_21685 [Pseudochelatococcus sp. B33]
MFTIPTMAPGMSKLIKNPTTDEILSAIAIRADIRVHPDQKSQDGTKFISAFVTATGTAFAVDKSAETVQSIWIIDTPAARGVVAATGIEPEFYYTGRGRNSNLLKLTGFRRGALIRVRPKTAGEAVAFIDALSTVSAARGS